MKKIIFLNLFILISGTVWASSFIDPFSRPEQGGIEGIPAYYQPLKDQLSTTEGQADFLFRCIVETSGFVTKPVQCYVKTSLTIRSLARLSGSLIKIHGHIYNLIGIRTYQIPLDWIEAPEPIENAVEIVFDATSVATGSSNSFTIKIYDSRESSIY